MFPVDLWLASGCARNHDGGGVPLNSRFVKIGHLLFCFFLELCYLLLEIHFFSGTVLSCCFTLNPPLAAGHTRTPVPVHTPLSAADASSSARPLCSGLPDYASVHRHAAGQSCRCCEFFGCTGSCVSEPGQPLQSVGKLVHKCWIARSQSGAVDHASQNPTFRHPINSCSHVCLMFDCCMLRPRPRASRPPSASATWRRLRAAADGLCFGSNVN